MQSDRIIDSSAPIRICDLGGWTDTWFAKHGRVLNIAVAPPMKVRIRAVVGDDSRPSIVIHAGNVSNRDDCSEVSATSDPLLSAALKLIPPPIAVRTEIWVHSDAPPASSTGTSAATCVALLGALDRLRFGHMTASELSEAAHRVETEVLGQQSGIQDQIAAAHGGISYIEMDRYPHANVSSIQLPDPIRLDLERQISLVFLGQGHRSSEVHERVIRKLQRTGGDAPQLDRLRRLAEQGRDTLLEGDLRAFGRVMIENTEAQAELHPALVGEGHRRVIAVARQYGAWGWKVNGAGGEGGSVTVLHSACPDQSWETVRAIEAEDGRLRVLPTSLSMTGVRVIEQPGSDNEIAVETYS